MPTNRRFARGFSNLHRLTPLAMGLSLGLVTSSAAADPAVKSARATLAFDSLYFFHPTGSVCTTGPIRCHAHAKVTLQGHVQSAAVPQGFGPTDLQSAYNIHDAHHGHADRRDRRRVRLPDARVRSRDVPLAVRPAAVHEGQRLPHDRQPERPDHAAAAEPAGQRRLDGRDRARRRHGQRRVPELQDPRRAGDRQRGRRPLIAPERRRARSARPSSATAGAVPSRPGAASTADETYFDHPGIAVFVSAGDDGYNDGGQGPDYPATSAHAIAVGGTTLSKTTGAPRLDRDRVVARAAARAALSIPKPAYQTDTPCQYKATTDIAAVGDPATGVAVYNRRTAAGASSVAPARPRRSSPRSSRPPATARRPRARS